MTGVPRSQVLLRGSLAANTNSTLFTSPAGHVTLVKSGVFWNSTATTSVVELRLQSGSPVEVIDIAVWTLTTDQIATWTGWVVLNPGDSVYVSNGASSVQVWISGAVLNGPNLFPPAIT